MKRVVGFDDMQYDCLYLYDDNFDEIVQTDISSFCLRDNIYFNRLSNGFNKIITVDKDGVKMTYVRLRDVNEKQAIDYIFITDSKYLEIVLSALKDVINKEAKLNLLGMHSDKFDEVFNVFDYLNKRCAELDIEVLSKEIAHRTTSVTTLVDKNYVLEKFDVKGTLCFMKDFRNICMNYYYKQSQENNELSLSEVCSSPIYYNGRIISVISYIHETMSGVKDSMLNFLGYCEEKDCFYICLIPDELFFFNEPSILCSATYNVESGEWKYCVLDNEKISEMLQSGYLKAIIYG